MSDTTGIFLKDLNEDQIAAVSHYLGPALVVAGPGSGKTRVLTHRVAFLIEEKKVPETNILCVTFTNKAADEIKSRVKDILGSENSLPWSGTFHSICAKILRKDGRDVGIPVSYVIYDTDDQVAVVRDIEKDFGMDTKRFHPRAVLEHVSGAKSEMVSPEMYAGYAQGYFQKTVAKIYPEYQQRLRQSNALDFDDLLLETVHLFEESPHILKKYQELFKFILVDEYQDTNKVQYALTKALANGHENLFVVGDMSQAIYSFRGADFRNILNFQNDYPKAKIYNLGKNYRSTKNILEAAKNLIKNNSTHIPLDLWTDNSKGDRLIVYRGASEKDEASFLVNEISEALMSGKGYSDIAVLYRTNAQSRNIEEHFIRNNIPYRIIGGVRFYGRKEIKDIISYLKVVHNPKDKVSWSRIINVPPRGIGQKSEEQLKQLKWDIGAVEEKSHLPIREWIASAKTLSTLELMEKILADTKYIEWLNDGTDENFQRIENINELKSVDAQFVDLNEFLENVALIESSDRPRDENVPVVTLMTVHASKGLEFPVIFIVGMEEGLFPHTQSLLEQDALEEERRLCYVAITRAKEKVFMTCVSSRLYFGSVQVNIPSRFLGELPGEILEYRGISMEKGKLPRLPGSVDDFLDDLDYNRNNFNW